MSIDNTRALLLAATVVITCQVLSALAACSVYDGGTQGTSGPAEASTAAAGGPTGGSGESSASTGAASTTSPGGFTSTSGGESSAVTTVQPTVDTTAGTTGMTSTEPTQVCGDGVVQSGEECDDGNADDADACTPVCKHATCGDGFVQVGVEECDDGNGDDTDMCTSVCEKAVCGDGQVHAGIEECDLGDMEDTDGACSDDCLLILCGDGVVQAGEECDDNNNDDTDMCTSLCKHAVCGDSIVQIDNEECDDGNLVQTDACINTCKLAKCGDGVLQAGIEACDDGNMVQSDACINTCQFAKCGDGQVRAGIELCDDGNQLALDGCESDCTITPPRIVFVTSQVYNGNLGGLAGADAKCQALAAAAKLPGTYKAWLSDSNGSPSTRMTKVAAPYVRTDGVMVAGSWSDLIKFTIAPINLTETKGPAPMTIFSCGANPQSFRSVYSNTNTNGTLFAHATSCNNWTSSNHLGAWGDSSEAAGWWTNRCYDGPCERLAPFYCFQQ
ncbi:MAG: DUF4215 domain-containing protein [Nannocystis sp.]|nr:DUF4215 domain-containing protein [Nannocystis sp.]MBA3549878.1 DUF4215 domain-containing protein [Nannocystis sp.]